MEKISKKEKIIISTIAIFIVLVAISEYENDLTNVFLSSTIKI